MVPGTSLIIRVKGKQAQLLTAVMSAVIIKTSLCLQDFSRVQCLHGYGNANGTKPHVAKNVTVIRGSQQITAK